MKFTHRLLVRMSLLAISFTLPVRGAVGGQPVKEARKSAGVEIGKPLFVCAATTVCGPWLQKAPFNPQMYGKVSGYSPTTSDDPKIVLYTLSLDKNFFRLATAVDSFVAKHKNLQWSVVQVIDAKGAQRGGYSAEEVLQRRDVIRRLAEQNKIQHFSFILSAPSAATLSKRLGLTDSNNLLVAGVANSDQPNDGVVVKWMTQRETAKLSGQAIQDIPTALEKAVGTP